MTRAAPEGSKVDGWIVTVAIFKKDSDDDEDFGHVTYTVAVTDPAEAVKLTLKDCGAKAAMLTARSKRSSCKGSAWSPAR